MRPYELWRSLIPSGARYPRVAMAPLMDYAASAVLDMEKFSRLLSVDLRIIRELTFNPVLIKSYQENINEKALLSSKVVSKYINYHRRFCPLCLKEKLFYRLIWQVKDCNLCFKHYVNLVDRCQKCLKPISLLGSNAMIGKCDYCNFPLENSETVKINPDDKQLNIYENWLYLLMPVQKSSMCGHSLVSDFIIRALFFILANRNDTLKTASQRIDETVVTGLFQTLSSRKEMQGFEYLDFIIRISRLLGIRLKELYSIDVPEDFVKSYLS